MKFIVNKVVVEGNIGAGKTTFLQPFKKQENLVQVVTEPVEKWRNLQGHNLLQKMYENPKRWSFEFQSYIQLTLVQEHMKPCHVPVKMMERSLLRFKLHIKNFNDFQLKMYCGMISTIYHFEFPAQLSANHNRLFAKLTNRVTG